MPLRDHFHPPLLDRRPWESFHATWAGSLADALNAGGLPRGYLALEHVRAGAAVEIDVGTFGPADAGVSANGPGGTAPMPRTVWMPAAAPVVLPAVFPPSCTVEIVSTEGGRSLAAAIELVSPANKDRERKRRVFAAKCATYLSRGVGLIVVDVVTSRSGNMHNELGRLIDWEPGRLMADDPPLYAVAYRPLRREGSDLIEAWPTRLALGEALPTLPLSLEAELCVKVDLEAAYTDACRRRHVDDAL